MTKDEIINAFAVAELALLHGAPITNGEKATFAKALRAIAALSGAERVAIREAIKATVATCIGKAA